MADNKFFCRMYENEFPKVDDVVMVNVRQIADMGAYVKLVKYIYPLQKKKSFLIMSMDSLSMETEKEWFCFLNCREDVFVQFKNWFVSVEMKLLLFLE